MGDKKRGGGWRQVLEEGWSRGAGERWRRRRGGMGNVGEAGEASQLVTAESHSALRRVTGATLGKPGRRGAGVDIGVGAGPGGSAAVCKRVWMTVGRECAAVLAAHVSRRKVGSALLCFFEG